MADIDMANDRRQSLSRRKVLMATGAIGAAAVAGCLSGDSDDSGGGGSNVLHEAQDSSIAPPDMNWNPFAEDNFPTNTMEYMSEWGAFLFHGDGKLRKWGFKDWSYDEGKNVLTTTLRDDLKKQNGNKYTAEDLRVYDELVRLQSPESSKYNNIEVADGNAVAYHLKAKINPDIFENYELTRVFWQGKERWQEWLEKYQDASDQKARDEITKNLKQLNIKSDEFRENGNANGVFKLGDMDDTTVTLEIWDEHRNADKIDFEELRIHVATGEARYNELLTNDEADIGRSQFPGKLNESKPEAIENLAEYPVLNNIKVLINWRNREYLRDRNVRRAMAAVINTSKIAEAAGNGKTVKIHSGMDPSFNKQYLGDAVDNFIDYKAAEKDTNLADKYMERSEYSIEDGNIIGPDGSKQKPMRFFIGDNQVWSVSGEFASRQLRKYGFPIETKNVGRSDKIDTVTDKENMTKWDLSTESHYAGGTLHPFSYFDYRTFWGWRLTEGNFGPSEGAVAELKEWVNNGEETSPYNGKPIVAEVPTEIGTEDLSGETKKVNIYELVNEIQKPSADEARQKEIIKDLSWAWNFHLPDIDTYFVMGGLWGDTANWNWNAEDWAYTGSNSSSVYWITKTGSVSPK